MQRYTIEDLNALVREFCKTDGTLELLEKIRELTLLLYVSKGDIPPNGFIELFNNAQFLDIKPMEAYRKNITPLKECYPNLQKVEKELLNIVIFIFDILNGESKKGVVAFLKRTFLFSASSASIQLRYTFNFIEHTLQLEAQEREILLNELLDKEYFFGLSFEEQKNILENIKNFVGLQALDAMRILLEESIKRNDIALQMQLYAMVDSLQGMDATIEKNSSLFYAQWAEQEKLPPIESEIPNGKKQIGIIVDTLADNEVGRAILSLTSSLEECSFCIYSLNETETNSELLITQCIANGCSIYSLAKRVPKGDLLEKALVLRERILKDAPIAIITTTPNTISNFLFATRSAKQQLFWSFHGDVRAMNNIEMQISHKIAYKENRKLKIFTIYEQSEFLIGTAEIEEQAQKIKKSFLQQMGEESVILGTIDGVQRIDNDAYMQDIALIMKKNPNAIYFICGSGDTAGIKQKIERFNMDTNRFTFMDSFDKHLFGWIIDIYVDSVSATYEHTIDEMINKQKPIVLYSEEESQNFVATVSELIEKRDEKFYEDFVKKALKSWNKIKKEQSSLRDILEEC
ncbi:hypothetical protein MNB_SM-5-261 [hydrothermal vent metagenome]|uniref:Uncharacterized protein n=1 Tax=hydrothermal vent metagenome TaxID=652676 RepID=A0A1W1CSG3_9ZZZZ